MCRKPGGKAVTEIIAAVTITREGTELNTKTTRRLKQTSVSVEKVFCCCDEPVPLLAFRELGEGEKRERRDKGCPTHCWPGLAEGKAPCLGVHAWKRASGPWARFSEM